jgi:phosphopantothenoylcysteine decarboxylase/phosphopantothenate--cysteine ligase
VISNKSTGTTGAVVADSMTELGAQVTFLHAKNSVQPQLDCRKVGFVSFQDVAFEFERLLKEDEYDLVIHAAAVSDYSVVNSAHGKISSQAEDLQLQLKRNPKLLNSVKSWSKNKSVKLIAFKMTASEHPQDHLTAVQKVIQGSQADLVIHNDLSEINIQTGKHVYHSYLPNLQTQTLENKSELTGFISRWIFEQHEQQGAAL